MLNRRSFLQGALAAPAVILTPGLLMPVKSVIWPTPGVVAFDYEDVRAMLLRYTMTVREEGGIWTVDHS